jgi:hypothetical protein
MATRKNTPKVRAKLAAVQLAPAEITERIRYTLHGLVIPRNPLCEAGNSLLTLENVHDVIALIDAVEVQEDFEMPDGGRSAIASIRQLAQDAIKYAATLCDGDYALRGAFDRGDMSRPAVRP